MFLSSCCAKGSESLLLYTSFLRWVKYNHSFIYTAHWNFYRRLLVLRFCPWLLLFKYCTCGPLSLHYVVTANEQEMAFFWPIGSEYLYCYTPRRMKLKRRVPPKVSLRSRSLPVFLMYVKLLRIRLWQLIKDNVSFPIQWRYYIVFLLCTTITMEGSLPRSQTTDINLLSGIFII